MCSVLAQQQVSRSTSFVHGIDAEIKLDIQWECGDYIFVTKLKYCLFLALKAALVITKTLDSNTIVE